MIIGISGRIGSGKDTVAGMIKEMTPSINWEVRKFAYKLKQIASMLTGILPENFENQEFKKGYLGSEWDYLVDLPRTDGSSKIKVRMTVRELLQKLGTDAMRNNLHPNVWVNALMADYVRPSHWEDRFYDEAKTLCSGREEVWGELPNWLITDCRFENEAQAIKDRGGIVIRVVRGDGKPVTGEHISESALDGYAFDYVIRNDSSLENLKHRVSIFLQEKEIV